MAKVSDTLCDPSTRQEFVLLFDVTNGNPNGDPDALNSPRIDPETSRGLVTDVALKRKIRDYVALTHGLPIFIQSQAALNTLKQQAADQLDPPLSKEERASKKPIPRLQSQMCADYFDIRMFGAVLATGDQNDRLNAGQIRGPVQITFAQSEHRINPLDLSITRQARTTEERMETGTTEMGRKSIVPYGLYRAHGYVNPYLAERTGVSADDLEVFWEALVNLFEFDRSAARPDMGVCGLYVFTHDSKLGNAPAHVLLKRVSVEKDPEVDVPRQFSDYTVTVDQADMPSGVTVTPLVG